MSRFPDVVLKLDDGSHMTLAVEGEYPLCELVPGNWFLYRGQVWCMREDTISRVSAGDGGIPELTQTTKVRFLVRREDG